MKMKSNTRKYLKWGAIGLLALSFLYAFLFLIPLSFPFFMDHVFHVTKENPIDAFGLMGDSYGRINALFSSLAFFGVLVTMLIQSRDNKKRTIVEQYFKMLDEQ